MNQNEYPFRLEKHPKKKGACPSCGHPKVFRYYEDLEGNTLESFGICDRANNCGYHATPKGIKFEGKEVPPQPEPVQVYPEGDVLDRIQSALTRTHSALHEFAATMLGISMKHFRKWGVGTEFKNTVFAFQDRTGRMVNAKYFLYGKDGKRNKKFEAFSLKQGDDPLKRYMICLFGEHLLDPEKKRTVIIVESEKSAVLASWFYPEFDWLACGANTGLSDAKIPAVFGRHVIWLCDADAAGRPGKSNSSLRKLAAYHVKHQVIDAFPNRTDGYDIADHIVDQKGQSLIDLASLIAENEAHHEHADSQIYIDGLDVLFHDAASLMVSEQQGSTSLLQRSLKIGYTRANRIMEQLEAAGIVGPFLADRARDVLVKELEPLKSLLSRVYAPFHDHSPAETAVVDIEPDADQAGEKGEADDELMEEYDDLPQVGLPREVWFATETRKMFRKYGFVEYQGQYWFPTYDEKNAMYKFKAGSNFTIRPLFLIISKSNPKRIYEVKNRFKKTKVVDLDPNEFVQLDGFRKNVESQGNFIFMGNQMQFMKVKSKLFDESREAIEVKTLGYHPDGFYAFANGIQPMPTNGAERPDFVSLDNDGYGIVENGDKRYFIPPLSKIYVNDEDEYQNAKKFIYNKGETTFAEYAKEFCDVHGDNGRIGLLYYISCLYRDIIFDRFRVFPHLFLFGPPQSGKSTMAWSISYLFGRARPPFALNTGTSVGFYKHFAEFRNAVVWFDEYLNSIDFGRVQSLKTAFDGNGHTKSEKTNDNRNKSIPVSSGCIVSGQELPTIDIALFTRCILLQYDRTDFSQDERQRLDQFHLKGKNLLYGHLTAQLSSYRELVEKNFFEIQAQQANMLKENFEKVGIDDRLVKNMSVLLAMHQVLKEVLKFPFSDQQIREVAITMLRKQNALISSSKETSTFWSMMEHLYRTGYIKSNSDFLIKSVTTLTVYEDGKTVEKNLDNGKLKKVLYLRFNRIHPPYLEHHRKQYGKNGMDHGSLKHYLEHSKGFYGSIRNVKFGGTPTSAYAFDYEFLQEDLDGLSLEDLNEEMDSIGAEGGTTTSSTENQGDQQTGTKQKTIPF